MKFRTRLRFALPCLPATLALCLSAGAVSQGATLYWDGGTADIPTDGDGASAGGDGTWNATTLNWDSGAVPHVAWTDGNDAVFGGAAGIVTLGTNISAATVTLGTNNYNITTAAGAALTVAGGVTTTSSYQQISGPGGLVLSGAQAFNVTGGLRVSTIVSGADTITKTGPGMLSFNNANNNFTGKIVVNQSRLGVNGDTQLGAVPAAPVADAITLDGGFFVDGVVSNANNGFDNGGLITIHANRGFTLGAAGGTFQVGYGTLARLTIAGVITGNGSLTKTDSGDLALFGANSYTGGTSITGGAISIGDINGNSTNEGSNTGLGSGDVNVAANGQLMFAGNNLIIANNITLNGAANLNNRQGALIGGFQDGASASVLNGTLTLAGTGNRSLSTWWSDKTFTVAGKVTGTGTLQVVNIKADNSNQGSIIILTNPANDYSGGTLVSAGNNPTLRVGASDVLPDGAGKGDVTVEGRLEILNGFSDTINGLSGAGTVALAATSSLAIGNNDATTTFNGNLNGVTNAPASLYRKVGNGTFTTTGANDNNNCRVRVEAGTFVLAKTNSATNHALGTQGNADHALTLTGGTARLAGTGGDQIYERSSVNLSGGTFDFAGLNEGFDSLLGSGGTISNSVAATTSTLTVGQYNSQGSPTFSGVIQNGAGTMALTKTGTGIQTLAGVNTYTGATNVLSGDLLVTGSVSDSTVTVSDGALLGGSGSVGPLTTQGINSIVSPGVAGIGILNAKSTVLTGILDIQIDATTNDLLQVTGDLNVTGASLNITELDFAAAPKYVIAKYTGTLTGTLTPLFVPEGYSLVHDTTAKEIYLSGGTPGAGFSGFMDGFPGLTTEQKAPGADPDNDGVSNLVEYALDGFDPTVANGAPGTLAGGTLSFTKRPLAVTNDDVTYAIEQSTTVGVAPSPWTAVTADTNDTSTISFTLPTGLPRDFVRLRVVRQD